MITTDQKKVLGEAIDRYGDQRQLDQCVEELAELIVAINKLRRAKPDMVDINPPGPGDSLKFCRAYFDVCGEIADVKIMMAQIESIMCPDAVQMSIDRKIERLKNRLKKYKEPQ